jgi:lipoprotein-releasing system ATP-binding protein
MLEARHLYHSYGELNVLDNVSLHVKEGEVVSIVGSSGAGKTTLLQLLGTLEKPNKGEILMSGIKPLELSPKKLASFRNKYVGFIFQFHQLLPEFTALENAILPALIGGESMKDATLRANELFEMLGIYDRIKHKPSELSGGEQQRVAVARSLINKPKVIFADEPSGNLDTKNSEELHRLFFDLREKFNQTFVIVTHNESLANMADRKLVMKDGKFSSEIE